MELVFESLEKNPGKLHSQTLIALVVIQQVKYEANVSCLKFQCFERIDKQDLNNTKLMLQFCRNRLKIEQNCKALSLMLVQILCYLLLVVTN